MSEIFGKSQNDFVFIILFVVLNLQTCQGNYDRCYRLSSGKDICFIFDEIEQTFEDSKQFCRNNGGFLLEIYNVGMQRIVEQYGNNQPLSFKKAWLNLVRTNSNVWFWGGEQSGYSLTYSNWEQGSPASVSSQGNNRAFLVSSYKWSNAFKPLTASTICIKGNRESFLTGTTTTSTTTRTTTTTNPNSGPTQTTTSAHGTMTNTESPSSSPPPPSSSSSSSAAAVGIVIGVVLGGLVLIIASSLLIAKFVFHKEIPLPFKSSRSTKSPPHHAASDVINGGYGQVDENVLAESVESGSTYFNVATPYPPSNSTLSYIGFEELNHRTLAQNLQERPHHTIITGHGTLNAYDNAP